MANLEAEAPAQLDLFKSIDQQNNIHDRVGGASGQIGSVRPQDLLNPTGSAPEDGAQGDPFPVERVRPNFRKTLQTED